MAHGVPLVTTEIGAQGLEEVEKVVNVTNDPEKFADHICKILIDDLLWREISQREVEYVIKNFSSEEMLKTIEEALDIVG